MFINFILFFNLTHKLFYLVYQFAQAALQLTGTGVGIANQASEGAWFPVVVENAAKINRDFQEKLLTRSSSRNIDNRGNIKLYYKHKNLRLY